MSNKNPIIHLPFGGAVRRREVVPLTKDEMTRIMKFHKIAQKYGIALVCQECDSAFQGMNQGHEKYFVVACKCRELKGENPGIVD